jgi:hypothetical protein
MSELPRVPPNKPLDLTVGYAARRSTATRWPYSGSPHVAGPTGPVMLPSQAPLQALPEHDFCKVRYARIVSEVLTKHPARGQRGAP